jgi:hypothetical protein
MVQSHVPPSPESGRDKRYYEHVMNDFHEQDDLVGQTSQYRDNGMTKTTFITISGTTTSVFTITTTPAHEFQVQTVAGVFKVVSPVKMNINVLTKIV